MTEQRASERSVFLSTMLAGTGERRLALAIVLVSAAGFIAAVPFAKTAIGQVWAFIPAYQSALVVNDLITATLLFGQYRILRAPGLLVLASGYLFTSFIAVVHGLTYPNVFSPTGLLGAGPQTTAWLYMLWHGGFPLFVLAYVLIGNREHPPPPGAQASRNRASVAVALCVAGVLLAVCVCALFATAGHDLFPAIMIGNHYTTTMIFVVSSVWGLSLLALVALWWWRRPYSVLDLWLTVVMSAWLFDIALAGVLNAARFDLGFYAGRIYGLLAATFVLLALLLENGTLYARLARAHAEERAKADELATANRELESFSYSVSHDLRAPLRAMDGYAAALEEDHGAGMDPEARRLLGVIRARTRRMGELIDDLLAFARLGREPVHTQAVSLDELVQQIVEELRPECQGRQVEISVGRLGTVNADPSLLKQAFANLLGNAVKFTRDRNPAAIEIGAREDGGARIYYVKDNGAGFDMRYAGKLFGVFQRLHAIDEFEGTGVGLAIVQRIISRHGGRVWAESEPDAGAGFYFTLAPERANKSTS